MVAETRVPLGGARAGKNSEVPEDAAAVVDGVVIKKSAIDKLLSGLGNNGAKATPEVLSEVLSQLVLREVLVAEAVRRGTDKKPDFLARMN